MTYRRPHIEFESCHPHRTQSNRIQAELMADLVVEIPGRDSERGSLSIEKLAGIPERDLQPVCYKTPMLIPFLLEIRARILQPRIPELWLLSETLDIMAGRMISLRYGSV
jgi:hypothetical protein